MEVLIKQADEINGVIYGAADVSVFIEGAFEKIYVTYQYRRDESKTIFDEFAVHDISLKLHEKINWQQEQRLKVALKGLTGFCIAGGF